MRQSVLAASLGVLTGVWSSPHNCTPTTAHWAVQIAPQEEHDTPTAIKTIRFHDSATGGGALTVAAVESSGCEQSPQTPASLAFDGLDTTAWITCNQSAGQWAAVTLAQASDVQRLCVQQSPVDAGGGVISQFVLHRSTDGGATWFGVVRWTGFADGFYCGTRAPIAGEEEPCPSPPPASPPPSLPPAPPTPPASAGAGGGETTGDGSGGSGGSSSGGSSGGGSSSGGSSSGGSSDGGSSGDGNSGDGSSDGGGDGGGSGGGDGQGGGSDAGDDGTGGGGAGPGNGGDSVGGSGSGGGVADDGGTVDDSLGGVGSVDGNGIASVATEAPLTPPPSRPPPASPPPLLPPVAPTPPGFTATVVVQQEFVIRGALEAFDESAFVTALAASLELPGTWPITLNVSAASVRVGATISGTPGRPASSVAAALGGLTTNLTQTSLSLGVVLESISTPLLQTLVVPVPDRGVGTPTGSNGALLVVLASGGAGLACAAVLSVAIWIRRSRRLQRPPRRADTNADVKAPPPQVLKNQAASSMASV